MVKHLCFPFRTEFRYFSPYSFGVQWSKGGLLLLFVQLCVFVDTWFTPSFSFHDRVASPTSSGMASSPAAVISGGKSVPLRLLKKSLTPCFLTLAQSPMAKSNPSASKKSFLTHGLSVLNDASEVAVLIGRSVDIDYECINLVPRFMIFFLLLTQGLMNSFPSMALLFSLF